MRPHAWQTVVFEPFEGNVVKAVVVDGFKGTRKVIDKLMADVEVQAGNKGYWFKVDESGALSGGIAKFLQERAEDVKAALGLKPGDFVGVCAGKKLAAQKTAGVLRKYLGAASEGHMRTDCYEFCWIVDFPMYEIGAGIRRAGVLPQPVLHATGWTGCA